MRKKEWGHLNLGFLELPLRVLGARLWRSNRQLKRHELLPMVATKWALQLLSKRQRIQMIFMNFRDQSILLERWFCRCSTFCSQCHNSTFHLRHSWKSRECPISSKEAKPRLTCCHSPTQAFIPGNLVSWSAASRNLKKKIAYLPSKKFSVLSLWLGSARSFLSLEPNDEINSKT